MLRAVGQPLDEKFPHIDRWWLIYGALVSGGLTTCFAGLNIFEALMPDVLGPVLAGAIVGGGSELLHQIIEAAGDLPTKWAAPYKQAGRHLIGRPAFFLQCQSLHIGLGPPVT